MLIWRSLLDPSPLNILYFRNLTVKFYPKCEELSWYHSVLLLLIHLIRFTKENVLPYRWIFYLSHRIWLLCTWVYYDSYFLAPLINFDASWSICFTGSAFIFPTDSYYKTIGTHQHLNEYGQILRKWSSQHCKEELYKNAESDLRPIGK